MEKQLQVWAQKQLNASVTFATVVVRFICLRLSLRFFGIVGGYKPRRMCLHCLRSPYDFFRRQTRTKPYIDLADIVRQPQVYHTIIMLTSQIARCPYDDLAEVARSRYADCAIVVYYVHEFKRPSMFILDTHFKVM